MGSSSGRRVGIEDLDPAMELLNLNQSELSIKLGYSANAISAWKKQGTMPQVATYALRGILSEVGAQLPEKEEKPVYTLLKTENNRPRVIGTVSSVETITVAGVEYFLIPSNI